MNDVEQDRQTILDAAARLLDAGPEELAVLIVRGSIEMVRPVPTIAQAGPLPADMSEYDAAILRAVGDRPLSSQQLARRAGHRHNSYFRRRLAALVEGGQIRHTRRGYTRHSE
ncbi:MAG TPA: hypothetical protein VN688_01995 [Gemmataceae bacterium]|nr:hypothetical protein [Gemmataceae bacterium]